jgi:hypothetical protein
VQVGGCRAVGIEMSAAVVANFGPAMAKHIERGLRQRQEVVMAKGTPVSHLARLAHHPHALGAQAFVPAVAATARDHLMPGGDQLADKPIAGERAGAGEQHPHRGCSAGSPQTCARS